nr:MAG TPA: Prohead core protein serine protease [Caudoviricetes sp.]
MNNNNDLMGFMYISESVSDNARVSNMNTNKSADLFYVTFDTNLQDFDVENRNRRYYDASNVMECIKSEKIQSLLRTGGWFGEFAHPMPKTTDEKLSAERIQDVPPKERAFKIMEPKLVGNVLTAKIQSAQGEVGEGFGKEVLAGWIPQFSARAIAQMVNKSGKPYVMMKRLITYDAPWFPSHAIAHATSAPKVTLKSFTESVSPTDVINGMTISLKEILEDANKDSNVEAIMEAFDLDISNMVGFDSKRNHTIIKDGNNVIYANINPDTVKKVNDFYNSFNF